MRENFNQNGYHLEKDFFDRERIRNIKEEAIKIFKNIFIAKGYLKSDSCLDSNMAFHLMKKLFNEDFIQFSNCGKQIQHLISLHSLSISDKVISTLNKLGIKNPVISTRPVLFFNHKDLAKDRIYHTMDYHQDWKSMQGSINSIVLWLPLMNISKLEGALKIVPGSHKKGLRNFEIDNGFGMVSIESDEMSNVIDVEVNEGDALFFSSFLIHSSGENSSNYPRWSAHFRYNDLDDPTFIKRGYPHAYIYKPIDELLSPDFNTELELKRYLE